MRLLLSGLFFLLLHGTLEAQLKDFVVTPQNKPENPIVQGNTTYPDNAIIIVYSAIKDVNFRSSLGGINVQRYNEAASRYEILITPQRQIIFVQKPGFRETRLGQLNPSPKEDFYFDLEEKIDQKVLEAAEPGKISIKTNPSGASILFNKMPLAEKTPYTIEYLPGLKHIGVSLPGYLSIDTTFVLQSGANVNLNFELELDPKGEIYLRKKAEVDESSAWELAQQTDTKVAYELFLQRFPAGNHAPQAKQKLAQIQISSGDKALLTHNYHTAKVHYNNARVYDRQAPIKFRLSVANAWERMTANLFSIHVDMPVGLNMASISTYDFHAFAYQTSTTTHQSSGWNHQKQSKYTPIVPWGISADFRLPIRIPYIPAMVISAKPFFNTWQETHLDRLQPLDYEHYSGIYEPTGEVINKVDTLSFSPFENAVRLRRFGVNFGFSPISFLQVYVPAQYISLHYQPGNACLDCQENAIEAGSFSLGLGVQIGHSFSSGFGIFGFAERWTGNFSGDQPLETEINAHPAFQSELNFRAIARTIGLEFRFPVLDNHLTLRYENPKISGAFGDLSSNLNALREMEMHFLQLRYSIHF
ncbi:MAG: PEGA domain-containing protein [Cryomorphaceae bacterium]|nr:PEGA domain-containing protein [Cryomorphaceae bacterium]